MNLAPFQATYLASDVRAYILHEGRQARCITRAQQKVIVVAQKAQTVELDIETFNRTRKHTNDEFVYPRRRSEKESTMDTTSGHKEGGPLFRLVSQWT